MTQQHFLATPQHFCKTKGYWHTNNHAMHKHWASLWYNFQSKSFYVQFMTSLLCRVKPSTYYRNFSENRNIWYLDCACELGWARGYREVSCAYAWVFGLVAPNPWWWQGQHSAGTRVYFGCEHMWVGIMSRFVCLACDVFGARGLLPPKHHGYFYEG